MHVTYKIATVHVGPLTLLHLIKTTVSDLIRNTAVYVTINYLIEDLENP